MITPPARRRADRRALRTLVRAVLLLLAGAVLFALGLGLGRALEKKPEPGGRRTYVRTLKPLPLPPERQTVTVTETVAR